MSDTHTASAGASAVLTYADVFSAAQPQATLPILTTRFSNAARLHKDLLDYFAARRDLEEQYLKNLAKLVTKRALFDAADSPSAVSAGGVYATPSVQPLLDALLKELQSTAAVHSELEDRIGKQIEAPLRALPTTHNDWSHIRELDDGLSAQLKELASLESQLDKDRKKLASTPSSNVKKHSQAQNKLNDTQQAYDRALALWATEGPFTFEAYQRIDKARLDSIVESVIQFETAQADAAQRLMKISEQTTTVALGLESGAEIRSFLRRAQHVMPKADTAPPASSSNNNSVDGPAPNGSQFPISASTSTMPTASMSDASLSSMANTSSAIGDTSASTTNSRRPPPPPGQPAPSSSGGSALRGALSRFSGRKGRDSQFGMPSSRDGPNTNTVYGSLPEDDAGSNLGVSKASRTPSIFRSSRTSVDRTFDRPRTANTITDQPGTFASSSGGLMAPLVPTRAGTKSSTASLDVGGSPSAPPVDAEGFSIPPPDRKPWETAPDPVSRLDEGTEDLLDAAPPLPSRVANLSIATASPAAISVTDTDRDREALERMRSTLGAPPSSSADGVTRKSTTSRRERRTTRGFNPQGIQDNLPEEGSPPSSSFTAPMAGLGGSAEGRTVSMLSTNSGFGLGGPTGVGASSITAAARAQTQGAAVNALTANPFESVAAAGGGGGAKGTVRASITETVNAVFAGSSLVRVQVVGEVQVLLSGSVPGKLSLSLGGPSAINRAAPNPAFLSPAASGAGEHAYILDTAAVRSTAGAGQDGARVTVLKYQLDLPAQSNEVVPVDVHAQWRCDPTQTSLMISYRPNASSRLLSSSSSSSGSPPSFDNFEIVVPVSPSGSVSNVMSKPEGQWDADASRLLWTLADGSNSYVLPSPGGAAETGKLLARLVVDKPSVPQPVNVRWSLKGRTVSALEVRVVGLEGEGGVGEGSSWSFEPEDVVRLAVSGKFMAT
ncbi:unnamed protein product [Tilletia laevis]|uniref:MHD domain-containing protein n=2 Tax=Tilletia TaxID=13289 RepID=A0A177V7G0_9BASI|nr:hypothetical protein CF336_g5590 [Tilletia laevis]KAE8257276.1 hypothetical protein A4X03_0g4727 [Tilletia caries]KAE8195758.1 hypothetical protein CF335_g5021 [Tilletia laevis]CAD6922224.1 unnamed protein product [Tilletia laevis]CAD6934524.1 unnamed protein product [Tilletia caries]